MYQPDLGNVPHATDVKRRGVPHVNQNTLPKALSYLQNSIRRTGEKITIFNGATELITRLKREEDTRVLTLAENKILTTANQNEVKNEMKRLRDLRQATRDKIQLVTDCRTQHIFVQLPTNNSHRVMTLSCATCGTHGTQIFSDDHMTHEEITVV